MKIVLVNPPNIPEHSSYTSCLEMMYSSFLDGRITRMFSIDNMGLASIATYLNAHSYNDVKIIDACLRELTFEETIAAIDTRADVIGITSPQAAFSEVKNIIEVLKKRGYKGKIILGGDFASLAPRSVMEDVFGIDYVITGDGEMSFLLLLQYLDKSRDNLEDIPNCWYRENSTICHSIETPYEVDRDDLPMINRRDAGFALTKTATLGIVGSAGCGWSSCSFCSPGKVAKKYSSKWVPRNIGHIADEIADAYGKYRPGWFAFTDSDFFGHCQEGHVRAINLFKEIGNRGIDAKFCFGCRADEVTKPTLKELKQNGLSQLFIGFESFIPSRLERFRKGATVSDNWNAYSIATELGIYVVPGHIIFDPYSTMEEVYEEILAYTKIDFYALTKLTKSLYVLPGTPMGDILQRDGLLTGSYYNYCYNFKEPRVGYLLQCLKKLENNLRPYFMQYYEKVNKKLPENNPLVKTIKPMHLEAFNELYRCIKLEGLDSPEADNIVHQFTSSMARTLNY